MYKYKCDICDREILDHDFFRITHVLFEVIFIVLFLIKLFSWMFIQSMLFNKLRKFPCTCNHKGFWHLTNFKAFNPPEKFSWFYWLFKFKLIRDDGNYLSECLLCMFTEKDSNKKCLEFEPLNNLTYLENIYKKK